MKRLQVPRLSGRAAMAAVLVAAIVAALPGLCMAQGDGMGDLGLGNLGLGDMNLGNLGGGGSGK
jgi:hypothetical protein